MTPENTSPILKRVQKVFPPPFVKGDLRGFRGGHPGNRLPPFVKGGEKKVPGAFLDTFLL